VFFGKEMSVVIGFFTRSKVTIIADIFMFVFCRFFGCHLHYIITTEKTPKYFPQEIIKKNQNFVVSKIKFANSDESLKIFMVTNNFFFQDLFPLLKFGHL
jgi:hypothetical protein